VTDNHIPLYKRMVQSDPSLHGLWFMGLAQTLPTLVNLAEQQSKLLSAFLAGRYALPSPQVRLPDPCRGEPGWATDAPSTTQMKRTCAGSPQTRCVPRFARR
jgi:hypothetical protein